MALARPARWRITLHDNDTGATALELPPRRLWPAGLVVTLMFAVFAFVWWQQFRTVLHAATAKTLFDLTTLLFNAAWLLGWSVGTFLLGALALLLLFYGESARIEAGRLVYVPHLGPLKCVVEYELARLHNLRAETQGGDAGRVRLRFSYDGIDCSLGDTMPQAAAALLIAAINRAAPAALTAAVAAFSPAANPAAVTMPPPPLPAPLSLSSPTAIALIVANCLPLVGVFSGHITLAQVMVLFWSENLIIGFFTLLKIIIVGRWGALMAAPFFAGHYGGFMAVHFMFVYAFFIAMPGHGPGSPELAVVAAMYKPLWPAAIALLISHALSFALNFIGRREYQSETVGALMNAPYKRVVLLHLTIIFGGWVVMMVQSTAPAVALLIGLKIIADLSAHAREHRAAPPETVTLI